MGLIVFIILIILLIGLLPTWPYSSGWGYYTSGGTRNGPNLNHSMAPGVI